MDSHAPRASAGAGEAVTIRPGAGQRLKAPLTDGDSSRLLTTLGLDGAANGLALDSEARWLIGQIDPRSKEIVSLAVEFGGAERSGDMPAIPNAVKLSEDRSWAVASFPAPVEPRLWDLTDSAHGQPILLRGEPETFAVGLDPGGRWAVTTGSAGVCVWPLNRPRVQARDGSKGVVPKGRPLQTLPYAELVPLLRRITNLRAVQCQDSPTGYAVKPESYEGWKEVPEW